MWQRQESDYAIDFLVEVRDLLDEFISVVILTAQAEVDIVAGDVKQILPSHLPEKLRQQ